MSKLKILSYILLGVSAIMFFYFLFTSGGMTAKDYAANPDAGMYKTLDVFLIWTYILFGITALLAIVLPIIGIVQNPKNVRKIIINIGVIVGVLLLSYLLSTGDALQVSASVTEPSATTWKLTDAGLIATYILLVISFVSIIAGGVLGAIRNR